MTWLGTKLPNSQAACARLAAPDSISRQSARTSAPVTARRCGSVEDIIPLSNTVTKSYAAESTDKYSRAQPWRKILMLTLQFALVSLATRCPSQACDAKMSMVWGQRGSIKQTG